METHIAICDDERQQRKYLEKLVRQWANENNVKITVDMFNCAEDFKLAWDKDNQFDILLLDIKMGQ